MLSLSRKDIVGSLATGVTAGVIVWQFAAHLLNTHQFVGVPLVWLLVITPLAWITGVELGHRLGRRWHFFSQFGRFVAIGLTNATVDFGLFNFLFAITGSRHDLFLWMNAISFFVAILHSYLWNRFWTFDVQGGHDVAREFTAFIVVNIFSLGINIGVAYFVFYELVALAGTQVTIAANIGKTLGAFVGLFFNFIGFRLLVFKKRHGPFDDPYVV